MKTLLSFLIPVLMLFSSCKDNSTGTNDETVSWVGDWLYIQDFGFEDQSFPDYIGIRIGSDFKIQRLGINAKTGKMEVLGYKDLERIVVKNETNGLIFPTDTTGHQEYQVVLNPKAKTLTLFFSPDFPIVYTSISAGKQIIQPINLSFSFSFQDTTYSAPLVAPSIPGWASLATKHLILNLETGHAAYGNTKVEIEIQDYSGPGSYEISKGYGHIYFNFKNNERVYWIEKTQSTGITITSDGSKLEGTFSFNVADSAGTEFPLSNGSFSVPLIKR